MYRLCRNLWSKERRYLLTDYALLVNKQHLLTPDYIPDNLVPLEVPFDAPLEDPKRLMHHYAAEAASQLFERGRSCGIHLWGISGYRSYARQKDIFHQSIRTKGVEHTHQFIAPPGASEHQTGLALDISCDAIQKELEPSFAKTKEGLWLQEYAPLYGFILRYPKGKEAITGFSWEPWHIRYVTKSLSLYLYSTNMTLEEYWAISS